MRRRKFLGVGASAAAAGASISCSRNITPWRFLTPEEARTLAAICDLIIPPDRDAGAVDAGVVTFIDRQLAGFLSPLQGTYRDGLSDAMRQGFADATPERKVELLRGIEKTPFFAMLVSHTMQGYYGGPRHGGNRGAASWRMLGVPVPPVRGRAQV